MKYYLVIVLLLSLLNLGFSQVYDYSHLYNNSAPELEYSVSKKASNYHFQIKLSNLELTTSWTTTYFIATSYQDSLITELNDTLVLRHVDDRKQSAFGSLIIPDSSVGSSAILFLNLTHPETGNNWWYDIPLSSPRLFEHATFELLSGSTEVLENYMSKDSPLQLGGDISANDSLLVYYYSHNFDQATPAMSTRKGGGQKGLSIDSAFYVSSKHEFTLSKKGMYFFRSDSAKLNGRTVKVTESHFPKLKKVDELISPIVYISKPSEYKSLLQKEEKKKALDRFWLSLAGNREKAAKIIKNYYGRVSQSNELFTTYKEGWKTDKGMVYIIFGPPDTVTKTLKNEVWQYKKNSHNPEIKFTFARIKNIFSNEHFTLIRNPTYSRVWFRTVDLWRKGKVTN